MDIALSTEYSLSRAPQLSSATLVNMLVERQLPESMEQAPLFGAAGITTLQTPAADGVHRGSWDFGGIGYFVIGTGLWSYSIETGAPIEVATGITGSGRVSMSDNGMQLCIVNGLNGWIYTVGDGLTRITAAAFYPAATVTFMDGYFIFDRVGTNEWFLSALYDGLTYNGLDFASAEAQPGTITATIQNLQLLFIFCSGHIEIWYDAGSPDFPFARYSGGILNYGCTTPYTIVKHDGAVFFLGYDLIVYRLQANVPIRISTHPIETALAYYGNITTQAWSVAFTVEGHKMVALFLPTALNTGLGTLVDYIMSAEENYPPAIVGQWVDKTQPNYCFCDKQYIGTSFDRVRRNIMYSAVVTSKTQDGDGNVLEANPTGKTLWNGQSATPSANTILLGLGENSSFIGEFVFQVAVKNLDTGVVTFYPSYDPAQLVPVGIGAGGIVTFTITNAGAGSNHGSYFIVADQTSGGSGYGITGVATLTAGAVTALTLWSVGASYQVADVISLNIIGCAGAAITVNAVNTGSDGTWGRSVFDSTLKGGDVLAITDPRTGNFWVHMESCELHVFRPAVKYAMEISPLPMPFTLVQNATAQGAPIGVTANWTYFWAQRVAAGVYTNKMQILPSSITSAERTADQLIATYTYDYPDNTYAFRQIIGPDGLLYVFGAKYSGTPAFKLWKAVPGTGFTDLTPWSGSTGPNANCAAWTTNGSHPTTTRYYMLQLPASNDLVLISKLLPANYSTPGTDPTHFRLDCTYYSIGGASFSYHEEMVYGYMDADWSSTDLAGAKWQVLDFLELDNDLEVSDFVHPVDYTTRRLSFVCKAMASGTPVDNKTKIVFVDYQFVYGADPVVIQVIPETGWDSAYPDYAATIGRSEVVTGSLPDIPGISSTQQAQSTAFAATDNGIWDRANAAIWLSGDEPKFCKFDPVFLPRYAQALERWNFTVSAASSPFLKLTTMTLPPGPPGTGYPVTFCWDISTSKWHERRSTTNLPFNAHGWRASTIISIKGSNLVGDLASSKIGYLDWTVYTEFDDQITGLVQTANVHKDRKRVYVSRFELQVEAGVGNGAAPDPQIYLARSIDGGITWSTPTLPRAFGGAGDTLQRLRWMGQGQGRQIMWQLTITAPVQRVLIGASADVEVGM